MELYLLLKFAHVVGAILWVGGVSILTILVLMLERRGDDAATVTGMSYVALLGNKVFAPVGLVVILLGLGLAWLGGYGFTAWTVLAAVIVAGTFTLGVKVLGPSTGRMAQVWADTGDAALCIGMARGVMRLIKIDLAAQYAIVALMVLKPGWTDPLLIVPALLVGVGVLAWRRGVPAPAGAQPA